jgi:hypothetical protein
MVNVILTSPADSSGGMTLSRGINPKTGKCCDAISCPSSLTFSSPSARTVRKVFDDVVLATMLNVSKPNGESVVKTALIVNNKNENKNEEEGDKEARDIVAFFLSLS